MTNALLRLLNYDHDMIKAALIPIIIFGSISVGLSSCGTAPKPSQGAITQQSLQTPIPKGALSLPDRTVFLQKDTRWADQALGKTQNDTLGDDGCLVTATAMALGNLGFETDPSDLNARLTASDSFTPRGWLIWDGIAKVTDNRAKAHYYDEVSDDIINQCLIDGQYPLVQFFLPSGRSHWAMIVRKSERGFHMRDPLRKSNKPLIFPRGTDAFKAVRCVGLTA